MKPLFLVPMMTTLALTGCAQMGNVKPAGLLNPVVSYNGQYFRVATQANFQQGRFADLPRPESLADVKTLDESLLRLVKATKVAKARKDVESVAVLQGMAARLLDYRTHITATSVLAYRNAYQTGFASLQPGSYAVLPALNLNESKSYGAALPAAPRVLLADNGTSLKGMASNATKQAIDEFIQKARSAPLGSVINSAGNNVQSAFPEGVPYVGTANGQEYVLERSGDSLILHNPGKAPVKVGLEQLGYIPTLPRPPETQQKAAPIMRNMVESLHVAMLQWNDRIYFNSPNLVKGAKGRLAHTDQTGALSNTPNTGMTAYRSMPEYRFAADAVEKMIWSPESNSFLTNCVQTGANEGREYYRGPYAEVVQFVCISNGKNIYDKNYFTKKSGLLQTWDSQMKDEATRKEVEQQLLMRDASELGIGMLPVAGNLNALSSCTTGSSLVEKALRFNDEKFRNSEALSGFVGVDNSKSALDRGLNCLASIPMLNNLKALNISPEKAAKLFGVSSEAMESAFKVSTLFDTSRSRKEITEQYKMIDGMTSANAKKLAKGILDTTNHYSSIDNLSQSLGMLTDLYGV